MRPLSRAFWIFFVVGGLSTLLQYLVSSRSCSSAAPTRSWPSAWAVSALLNYGLNYRLAFHSGRTSPLRPAALCDRL